MPLEAFLDPAGRRISPEEAPDYFEEQGIMPADAVTAVRADLQRERPWPFTSPSQTNPNQTCRREIVLKRYYPFAVDPRREWAKMEGSYWHGFWEHQDAGPGWRQELWLPGPEDVNTKGVREYLSPEGEKAQQLEVYPGIWMRGRVDRVSQDWRTLVDHKTSKWARTDYSTRDARETWPFTLNLYARMLEMLHGTRPRDLWVWRMYRASPDDNETWAKRKVMAWTDEQWWEKAGEHTTSLVGMLEKAEEIRVGEKGEEAMDEHLATIPLDGHVKKMFMNRKGQNMKCGRCTVKELCFRKAGKVSF